MFDHHFELPSANQTWLAGNSPKLWLQVDSWENQLEMIWVN
jgi:hypothetical protein